MNKFFTLIGLLITILFFSCKKEGPVSPQPLTTAPSITSATGLPITQTITPLTPTTTLLFTVYGDRPIITPTAILDIRMDTNSNIFIYDRYPGYGLGWGYDRYTIIDESGKQYQFTSRTAFEPIRAIGLKGKIRILKNCSVIFTNQSTEVETVFTLKEAHVYDIFHHFDKFSTTLQVQVITTTNDVYIHNEHPDSRLGWGDTKYTIIDACGKAYKFISRTEFEHANTPTGLRGVSRILKDGTEIFRN